MAAPNVLEKKLLSQFRERLADLNLDELQNSDMFLIRWIRARDHNLEQAESMLRKSLIWQKENNLEGWTPPPGFEDDLPFEHVGFDEDNQPIMIVLGGLWDFRKIVDKGQQDEFLKFKHSLYERFSKLAEGKLTREGVPVTQSIFILDLGGSTFSQMTFSVLSMMKQDSIQFEANYPEVFKDGYVLNAPWFVTVVMNFMKNVLPEKTMGKFKFYSSDPKTWQPVLKEVVPEHLLPPAYGGTNTKSMLNEYLNKS